MQKSTIKIMSFDQATEILNKAAEESIDRIHISIVSIFYFLTKFLLILSSVKGVAQQTQIVRERRALH